MCELSEMSGYEEGGVAMLPGPSSTQMVDLCKLCKCGHMMHRPCLLMLLKSESAKVCVCTCVSLCMLRCA